MMMLKWFKRERWEVTVLWEGELYRHVAMSEADALDWMGQYPANASPATWCNGELMAIRDKVFM